MVAVRLREFLRKTIEAGQQDSYLILDCRDALGTRIRSVAEVGGDGHEQITGKQCLASGRDNTRSCAGFGRPGAALNEKGIEGLARAVTRPNRVGANPVDVGVARRTEHQVKGSLEVGSDQAIE